MTDASDPAVDVQERNVAPLPVEHRFAVRANRWAIIVGISEYEDARLNLTWANRDAQKLYELIQTPAGGGFEPERIELLIDGKATTAAVTRALRSFLKKPAREDVVLLYFACHGTPDLDRPSITYLLTHDTDPDDVSGTALPMREIDISLRENLLAEKVVIIADTCHSASIGNAGGRRDAGNDAGAINAYLEKVSEARDGVALLTSAESNETAREGTQWGKGHGVFTYFLLRGLQGEADGYGRPKDGVVSVGELFDYVRDNVKRATDDQQHPAIGTTPFDRNLPMAITGGVSAREHLELGRRLLELGRRLDERERYLAAASRFAEAVSLSGMAQAPLPEASLGLGHALLAAGEPQRCTQALQPLVADRPPAGVEEALLVNGIAHAKLGDAPSARASFERFIAASPAHEYAAWARSYLKRPQEAPGRRLSLLIGIDQYLEGPALTLRGCVNDVRIMERALFGEQGASAGEVVTVTDALATKNGIARAFADLADRAGPADTVFVHYSGHSVPDRMDEDSKVEDTYLLVHDTVDSESGVSAAELHEWLQAIPSQHTTIVLDTHPRRAFMELAEREGDYHVMIASDSAQMAYETRVQIDGELVTAGSFTSALAGQFADSDPATLTFGSLLDGVIHRLEGVAGPEASPPPNSPIDWPESTHQVPVLIGERDDLVFGVSDEHLWAYDFSLRRTYPRESVARLRTLRRHVPSDLAESLPALDVSFGRAFIEHHGYDEAIDTLDSVVDRAGPRAAEVLRLLAAARLGAHRLVDAAPALEALATRVERAEMRTALGTQAAALERAEAVRPPCGDRPLPQRRTQATTGRGPRCAARPDGAHRALRIRRRGRQRARRRGGVEDLDPQRVPEARRARSHRSRSVPLRRERLHRLLRQPDARERGRTDGRGLRHRSRRTGGDRTRIRRGEPDQHHRCEFHRRGRERWRTESRRGPPTAAIATPVHRRLTPRRVLGASLAWMSRARPSARSTSTPSAGSPRRSGRPPPLSSWRASGRAFSGASAGYTGISRTHSCERSPKRSPV